MAPLLRVGLLKLADGRQMLALDGHHIVVDGQSLTTLFQEFVTLYLGQPLRTAPRQIREHAAWEREFLRTQAEPSERYWVERLAGELPRLTLPTDAPRPPQRSFVGGELRLSHPAEGLRQRAQERGASLYMLLLAAYKVLLQQWTGQRETVVGTAHAGRQRGGFEGAVGMFVNSLPVRTHPGEGTSFLAFLDEVKRRCLEAYEHQDLPFELLARRLGAMGERGANPLFDTMFSYEHADERVIQLPGLSLRELFLPKPTVALRLQPGRGRGAGDAALALRIRARAVRALHHRASGARLRAPAGGDRAGADALARAVVGPFTRRNSPSCGALSRGPVDGAPPVYGDGPHRGAGGTHARGSRAPRGGRLAHLPRARRARQSARLAPALAGRGS